MDLVAMECKVASQKIQAVQMFGAHRSCLIDGLQFSRPRPQLGKIGGCDLRPFFTNETDCELPTLPDLPAVRPLSNGGPEHSPKRRLRPFLRHFSFLLNSSI